MVTSSICMMITAILGWTLGLPEILLIAPHHFVAFRWKENTRADERVGQRGKELQARPERSE